MSRPFRFDLHKTLQSVCVLLRNEQGRRLSYLRVLKLLYLAEREILAEGGIPLTGSRVVAMKDGPVLEDVYDLIRGRHPATPVWSQFIRKDQYFLEMQADPGVGKLSRFIVEKLEEVIARHRGNNDFEVVDETHRLEEWRKNDPGESSRVIPLSDIMAAIGRSGDTAAIVSAADFDAKAADFFGEASKPD